MARRSALSGLSLAEINRELRRRQRTVGTLERRRAALLKKVAAIDAEIVANGGSGGRGGWSRAAGGGRTRPKNEVQLLDALKAALKGKTMSVTEAAEAVQKAGYQTSSVNFRTIVNQTLINNLKKGFKRVGRGQYTAS